MFNAFVQTFDGLEGSTIVSVAVEGNAVSGVGQRATFTLRGAPGMLQAPFSVESIRFDPANHTFSVKTLPGHPLFGWRYWKVSQLAAGRLRIDKTGAVDKPAPGMVVPYWWSRYDQLKTWQEYLTRIRDEIGAQQDFGRPNAPEIVKGVWGYSKVELMRNVCGSEPVIGTWVCQ